MKSISVKVNDSVQTIAQTKVVTKDGQPTVIKATRNANYELINDATGYAPDHIVTKRVGKDLHISFEDDAKESDLIIKDFYDYDKSALIGQAESGQYHYYVPDTGLTQDYVTELVIGDIEGQALGGQGYPAPWWIGAEEGSRFGVMPWLVGIAGLAGIAAVVSGRDDKGNDNNNNANASAQEKPLNIENIQSDTVAQGATQALNFTVTSNGQNVSQAIISVNGTELKDANNKTVLTDKDGKVNISAQLLEANGIKLGKLPDFTISAKKEHYTEATATLHNPEVVTMDGGVVVTPHESATELEVTYTKPGQTVSTTAKFTHKDTNGDGKADAWIDNNKDDSVTIDPATGKVVIPVNTIGSKTNVTAKQTTDVGTTNNSKGVSDILSAKPVVEAIKTGDDAGNVVIKPSDDAINGSKVIVSYTDADGKSNTATIAKDKGAWTADASLPKGVSLDKDKGTVTISSDNVTDGSDVSATQTDPGREESVPASDRAKTSVPQPKINANDDGSVTVTPSDKANKVTINYTDEDGKQNTATIAKDNNGKWTSNDDKVVIGNDGSIILPDNNVKDGSEVSANQTVGTKDSDKGTATAQNNATPTPKINANDDGSVTVTPSDKANKVTINYTDEDGKQNTATIAKDNNGKWTSNDDKVVIGNDGSITIPADKVKDGSTATAEQTVGTKDSGKVPVVVNNQNSTTPAKPASPEINANDDGSVTVTPSDKANKVTINYTDEDGKQNTATIAKDNNGKWTSNDDKVVIGNDGSITIPADKVKDGSKVTAQQTTSVGISNPANTTAKDSIAEPEVTANNNGSVTVKPAKDATKVEISYVDEDNKEQTVTANKDNNGKWTSNNDKVVIGNDGSITIPADKVKDGSDVTANQTTNNGKSGDSSATVADAPSTTFTPTTTDKDITITVAGDDIVNKAEADQTTVPVVVKVTPQNGETVTDVTVTVNGKPYKATPGTNGNYTAQVPSADIKTDADNTATAKVTLSKADKTGTVTDTGAYTVDTDAPTVNATRQPDNSITGKTDPNTVITDKDGNPINDAKGKPIVSDADGNFTIPAGKVPADNTIGAKDKAGNVGTGNVDAPSTTFTPTTTDKDITITVAGDDIVNKAEADQTTVPVVVKVTPQNGETVTDVTVTVNGKPYKATPGTNGNYTAQVPSADIKTDADNTATAKVTLSKADKTGTVTDTGAYTVDTDAPTVNATRQPDNSITGKTDPNTVITDKDGNPINDAKGKPIVSDADGNFTIPAGKVPADNTIGAKDKAGNVGTGNVDAPSTTFTPTTTDKDITITVAGDDIVNKAEADQTTVPVVVKVTPQNGETVTDVTVTVNGKPYKATPGTNGNYTAQVPSADIKTDADNTATAKVTLSKADKTGTVTDTGAYTVDTDAPTVNATRQPDNSITGKTDPNTVITDKDGNPINDAKGKPIVSDADGNFTIPAGKVPADNTIGAKDKAGNVGTGNVDAPSTTFTPTTTDKDITITVAGDDIVNKAEADQTTVPVVVKVTPQNGETVTDVTVTVNGKPYKATPGTNGNYTAQVPSADIKTDADNTATAKVTLSKADKTGTVTDTGAYTVDTDAPTVNATRQPDNSITGKTDPNTVITDKDGNPINDAKGKPIVSDADGNFTIPAGKVPADNTIGAKDKAGNVGTGNVDAPSTTFTPTTTDKDITITVAGDDIVNKAEADQTTVPVVVKVTPQNGETVTDVTVTVNGKPYKATPGTNGNYTAQVPSADIKTDADNTATAKVTLSKADKTGTVTDTGAYTVDTDAPTVNATRQPDNSITGKTDPNTVITDKDGNPINDAKGKPIVSDADGNFTIPAGKVPADNTIGAKDKAGNVGTGNVTPADTTPPKVKGDPTVDGTGTTLTVPFSESLDDKNPPAKENFAVTVDSKPVKPTAVTVDGDKVKLTLPTPAKQGDKVSVSYTDPTAANDAKAVQDKAGNDAASFTNTPVTNGSTVTTPSKLEITTEQTEIVEGDKDGTVTFKVTRTEGTDKESSVKWTLTGTVDNPATVTGKDSDFADGQPTAGKLTFAPGETEKIIEVKIKDDTVVEKTEGFTVTLSDAKGAAITTDSASSVIKNDDKLVVGLAKDSYSERPQVGSDNDQYTNNPKINISNIPEGVEWEYRLNNGKWEKGEKPNDEGTGTFDLKPAPDVWQGVSYKIEARVKSKDYDSNSTLGSLDMTLDQSVRAPIITGVKSGNQITGIAEANSFVYIDKDGSGTYTRGDVGTVANNKGEFTLPFGEKLKETGRDGPLIFSRQNKDTPLASLGVIDEAGNALSKKDMSHFFYFDSLDGYDYFSTATSKTGTTAASTTKLQDIPHTVYVNNVISAGTFNFGSADDVLVQNGGYLQNNSYINMGAGDDYAKFNYIRQAGYGSVDMGSGNDILEVGLVGNSSFTGSTIKLGEGDDVVRGGSVGGVRGSLDGGKGYDFWDMTGSGIKHDLNNISGMEVIDLGGRKNVLQVKISDVVKNADTATLIDGQSYQGLFINGNGQDKVDLGANGSPRRGDKLGGFVKDIREGKAPEGYDAYWDGNNENTHVFIQKGIEVI
ncbi:SwmB domain-containing protein [Moraxella nonliquefaciens]|uniref:Calx-beta domain-containing protein n=1 Tax=Moraxella nonliquefaciens TaxID=478 RepID=A0A7T3BZ15_MORNO|nr:SwmB domain-containing protein [Moraxella nonliquefaciens]QPT44419.1 hypothetical protein I6G26_10310 [Moraxella nonliquefaciens]QQC29440.1 hypothetical protein I6H63_09095 [Moraxella nonliquefaciens]